LSNIDDLLKLKELLDGGGITQAEYDEQKEKILARPEGSAEAAAATGEQQAYQAGTGAQPGYQANAGAGAQQSYQAGAGAGSQPGYQTGPQPNYYRPAHTPGTPYGSYQEDVEANKVFGILAYISFLCFVTIFAAPKESHYSRFHANQGLVLFIAEVILLIVRGIIVASSVVSMDIFSAGLAITAGAVICNLIGVAMLVLAIIGIVNAVKGEMKPLPVIGGIQILK
jgi:uncharacterized membrane protein